MQTLKIESQDLLNQLDYLKQQALRFTKDEQNAQDLVQDVIIRAIKNLDKFQAGTNLQGWLYTIMRNTFLNSTRRLKKNVVHSRPDLGTDTFASLKVESRAQGELEMAEIQESVDRLPKVYREPFMMHVQGFRYEEIAEQLQIPLGTVKNRIHRGRKILKKKLLPAYRKLL